jgi:DNA-binding transcriptional MerR regulator
VSIVCHGQKLDKEAKAGYSGDVSAKHTAGYPIRAAARLTGLSIDTLRAWERRYAAVKPFRGARGRLYDEGQLRRLRLLKELVASGHAIGQIAPLPDSELEKLAGAAAAPALGAPALRSDAGAAAVGQVIGAVETYDYAAANAHLGRLALLLPEPELVRDVVVPLMRTIGERWRCGELSVAQEHMTSALLRNLLGGLVRIRMAGSLHPRILLATPSGELHEFGILAAAMLAVASGLEPLYLGPHLPGREIAAAAARTSPRAVVLGVKADGFAGKTLEDLRVVASSLPEQTELWFGGDAAQAARAAVGARDALALENFEEYTAQLARLKEAAR